MATLACLRSRRCESHCRSNPYRIAGATYAIIGAAIEVHRELGHGFLEMVYQDALALEFSLRAIPFEREVALPISYKGSLLPSAYRADFICFGGVVVETKALSQLTGAEDAQAINYLKATGFSRALLLNFGTPSLVYKRLVFTHPSVTRSD